MLLHVLLWSVSTFWSLLWPSFKLFAGFCLRWWVLAAAALSVAFLGCWLATWLFGATPAVFAALLFWLSGFWVWAWFLWWLFTSVQRVLQEALGRAWFATRGVVWLGFGLCFPARDSGFRGGLEVCPGDTQVDRDGNPVDLPQSEGVGVGSQRHTQLSSHLTCGRLRRRAVWVRRLESVLGAPGGFVGRFVRGRWVPDLPAAGRSPGLNVLLDQFQDGAKILGGGSLRVGGTEDMVAGREAYYHVELSDGSREVLFPSLVSKLGSYALLRQRDAALVSALRLRALEWCKKVGFSEPTTYLAVPSAISAVWNVSVREERLVRSLSHSGPGSSLWWGSA